MHINQFIAHAGVCARRAAEKLVKAGKISINGRVHTDVTYHVQPEDKVTYQGKVLRPQPKKYLLLHKPVGYVTTLHDPQGRRTVMDLLDSQDHIRLYPVGRLDYMTKGLLIFTNDGFLADQLAHPSQGVSKRYEVTTKKEITNDDFEKIEQGVTLSDGPVRVDTLKRLSKRKVSLSIHMGRNRIIRRLFKHLGHHITQLTRTHYAHLSLEGITEGKWRWMTTQEVNRFTKN